jgi:hypothetical protein
MKKIILPVLLALAAAPAFAAVGCDLNDPDRDVARLFPGSTGYRTQYLSVKTAGGPPLLARIEERLGDRFKGLYETIDVPYTLYHIYKGKERIGYIHGVNQKGEFGGIQVFLSLGLDGRIKAFYIQKLTSKGAAALRSKEFGGQFEGLTLADLAAYDPLTGKISGEGPASSLRSPSPEADRDFRNVLRSVKKNLILMDELLFKREQK